jgi:hypothetical protein
VILLSVWLLIWAVGGARTILNSCDKSLNLFNYWALLGFL